MPMPPRVTIKSTDAETIAPSTLPIYHLKRSILDCCTYLFDRRPRTFRKHGTLLVVELGPQSLPLHGEELGEVGRCAEVVIQFRKWARAWPPAL
jgi:hypothetical protein